MTVRGHMLVELINMLVLYVVAGLIAIMTIVLSTTSPPWFIYAVNGASISFLLYRGYSASVRYYELKEKYREDRKLDSDS